MTVSWTFSLFFLLKRSYGNIRKVVPVLFRVTVVSQCTVRRVVWLLWSPLWVREELLFDNTAFGFRVNVGCGPAEERLLLTGLHAVADIYCENCHTTLGWKYVSTVDAVPTMDTCVVGFKLQFSVRFHPLMAPVTLAGCIVPWYDHVLLYFYSLTVFTFFHPLCHIEWWQATLILIKLESLSRYTLIYFLITVVYLPSAGTSLWAESEVQGGEVYHRAVPHDKGQRLGLRGKSSSCSMTFSKVASPRLKRVPV